MKYRKLNEVLIEWNESSKEDSDNILKSEDIKKSIDLKSYYKKKIQEYCLNNLGTFSYPFPNYWLVYDNEPKHKFGIVYIENIPTSTINKTNFLKITDIEWIPFDYCLLLGNMYTWHMKWTPDPPKNGVTKRLPDSANDSDWDLPELVFSNKLEELMEYWNKGLWEDKYFRGYHKQYNITENDFYDRLYNYTLDLTPIYNPINPSKAYSSPIN